MEKSKTDVISVTMPLLRQAIWGHILKRTMEKSQTNVTLHAFENKQWRKFKQMSGEQMFYNQQPSQAGNLLGHPYLGANYTKLLWGRDLKLLGKLHNFPGHSLCLSQIWTQFTISHFVPSCVESTTSTWTPLRSRIRSSSVASYSSSSSRPPCTPSSPSSSTSLIWPSRAEIIWWTGSPIVSLQGWGRIQTDL